MKLNSIIILSLLLIGFGCDAKHTESSSTNSASMDASSLDTVALFNFDDYSRFQTFDEFEMRGKGIAKDTPYVYVRQFDDTIFVVTSNNPSKIIRYIKGDDYWFNEQSFDLHKASPSYRHAKDGSRPARTYYRYLMRDTIVEYLRQFQRKKTHLSDLLFLPTNMYDAALISHEVFIKTRTECVHVELEAENDKVDSINPLPDLRKIMSNLSNRVNLAELDHIINLEDHGFLRLNKHLQRDTLVWHASTIKQQIYYKHPLNALGEFEYRCGIDEGCRWPTTIANVTEPTTDGWYYSKYLDEPVSFPGGQETFSRIVSSKMPRNASKKKSAVLALVNEEGRIYSTQLAVVYHEQIDTLALDIVDSSLLFNPPMRNGKPVKSRVLITLDFGNRSASYK